MLQIRPNCECCNKDLAPNATDAMICSYECTFCQHCVDTQLKNVCPNCGGGFVPRPIRPKKEYREGISRQYQTVSQQRVNTRYTAGEIAKFIQGIKAISPEKR